MSSGFLMGIAVEGRRAARGLIHSPGFSVGVVLVLGIAIAGMVTVATAAYSLFLRPLPFAQPEQLVRVLAHSRDMGFDLGFSPPMLDELREEPMVREVAAYHDAGPVESSERDTWQKAPVTHNLTQVLGMPPIAGRPFTPADAEPGALPVVLISESAWRNRFDEAAWVIGSEIALENGPATVIGVMPAAFSVPSADTQLWEPLTYTTEDKAPNRFGNFMGNDGLIVRLKPGFGAAQLEHALKARYASDPRASVQAIQDMLGIEFRVGNLRDAWTAEQRQPLAIIGLASLFVFAAALFNVAGLWLARLLGRSHEQAIQAALGAGKWRRLGRTLLEFILLGAIGACLALALAPLMIDGLEALGTLGLQQPLPIQAGPATVAITIMVLGLGGLPVLMAAGWQQGRQRRTLIATLGSGRRGSADSSAKTRRVLIVAQVALAMSLLCAMGLLLRSWHALLTEDLGFEPRNLLLASIEQGNAGGESLDTDYHVLDAIRVLQGIAGISGVTHTNVAPFGFSESAINVVVLGQQEVETPARNRNVGEDFFRIVGIPVLRGRAFQAGDGEAGSVIVDQHFASLHFPQKGAVGRRLRVNRGPDDRLTSEIIGVAANAKYRAPDEQPGHGVIYQLSPRPRPATTLVIAASVPPEILIDEVKSTLERTVGAERTGSVITMESLVRRSIRDREPQLILLGLFGLEALALAAIGLFSLLAYSVRARTAEFGVRQAVGAAAADIRRHVLGDAVRLLVPGLAIGIAGAFLAGYLIANRLYEVSPADPLTWIAAGIVLALIVLAAGLWPAARAARIQPTEALRHE